jgi:arylsulfatase A-like enzyme
VAGKGEDDGNFTRRGFLGVTAGLTAASLGCSTDERTKRPNVLVILVDQLRYDVFSHRGDPIVATPNVDRLVSEGVLFSEATCSSPACGSSRAGMLSASYGYDGRYVFANREPDEPGPWRRKITTIDEVLDAAGYHVEYHGKWHTGRNHRECYRGDRDVFGKTMPAYRDFLAANYPLPPDDGRHKTDRFSGWPYRFWAVDEMLARAAEQGRAVLHFNEAGVFDIADEHTMTAWTVGKTIRFLESQPPRPFAVTCSILQPHSPLIASPRYARLFDPADMPMPVSVHDAIEAEPLIPNAVPADERGLGQFMALYYGLVKEVDDWTGRLLDTLEATGATDDTLVVFTSDHGEMMGAHGTLSKTRFFEESFRVPLVFHYPRKLPAGVVHSGPASGVDIGPTILDYCGLAAPAEAQGRSLRGAIEGGARSDPYAYGELGPWQSLRSSDHKFVQVEGRRPQLFDLREDPYEMRNLLARKNVDERSKALAEELSAHLARNYPLPDR